MSGTPVIKWINLKEKYRGLGIPEKIYGDMMKNAPDRMIYSDSLQSDKGKGIWERLKKRPGYEVRQNPLSIRVRGNHPYPHASLFGHNYSGKLIFKNEAKTPIKISIGDKVLKTLTKTTDVIGKHNPKVDKAITSLVNMNYLGLNSLEGFGGYMAKSIKNETKKSLGNIIGRVKRFL